MWKRRLLDRISPFEASLEIAVRTLVAVWIMFLVFNAYILMSPVSNYIKYIISFLHIVSLILFIFSFLIRHLLMRDPYKDWRVISDDSNFHKFLASLSINDNRINPKLVGGDTYIFATTPENLEITTQLNREGFDNSIFAMGYEARLQRNMGFANRSYKAFMLIFDPLNPEEFIGFSCVLPLSEAGNRAYLDGKIKDTELTYEYLASTGEKVESLLIFAIYLRKSYTKPFNEASNKYLKYLLLHVYEHVKVMSLEYITREPLVVYVQAEKHGIKWLLDLVGFVECGRKTADGLDLFQMIITARFRF